MNRGQGSWVLLNVQNCECLVKSPGRLKVLLHQQSKMETLCLWLWCCEPSQNRLCRVRSPWQWKMHPHKQGHESPVLVGASMPRWVPALSSVRHCLQMCFHSPLSWATSYQLPPSPAACTSLTAKSLHLLPVPWLGRGRMSSPVWASCCCPS